MRRCFVVLALSFAAPALADDNPPKIQDNSFLLEESYNQEWGVVQHINTFTRSREGDWVYTLTQEWPVRGLAHQLSYTIPYQALRGDAASRAHGFGDVLLNYRYQWKGDGEARLACSPRASLVLPTGDSARGLGAGGAGLQVDVPVSWAITPALVTHLNAGATRTFSARDAQGDKASLTSWNLGESLIWLARPRFNVMLEAIWTRTGSVAGPHRTASSDTILLSPGLRWSFDFKSGLQIVPGIACPLGVGASHGQRLLLAYLSFEHPFKHRLTPAARP